MLALLVCVAPMTACLDDILSTRAVSVPLRPDLTRVAELGQPGVELIDSVHIALRSTSSDRHFTVGERWPADEDEIRVSLNVEVNRNGEDFDFRIELWAGEDLPLASEGRVRIDGSDAGTPEEVMVSSFEPVGARAEARSIQVADPPAAMVAGDTVRLSAVVSDEDGAILEELPVRWESLTGEVATVLDEDGLVAAEPVLDGLARIRAFVPYTVVVDTIEFRVLPGAISVRPAADTAHAVGDTLAFSVVGLDAAGAALAGAPDVTWQVAGSNVVEVVGDDGGTLRLHAVGTGEAVVSAAFDAEPALADSARLVVVQVVETIAVAPGDTTLVALGDTVPFSAVASDARGNHIDGINITWTSLDTTVVAVDGAGAAVARGNGSAGVVARNGSVADTASVTVAQQVAALEISPDSVRLAPGDTARLHVHGSDANGFPVELGAVEWEATGDAAVIDGTGLVTGTSSGAAVITASSAGRQAQAVVIVTGGPRGVVAAGREHSCMLDEAGKAWCWGSNQFGQLGIGSDDRYRAAPAPVAGGHTFTTIRAAEHVSCALDPDGQAWCWGDNRAGKLGDGTGENANAPVAVAGGHTFRDLAVGWAAVCAVTRDGEPFCWGQDRNDVLGTTGLDECVLIGFACNKSPRAVGTELRFRTLDMGLSHVCGLTDDDAMYCWGWNAFRQLGDGTSVQSRPTPDAVDTELAFRSLVAGAVGTCAITHEGAAYCWGYNQFGQAGIGATGANVPTPEPVAGGLEFSELYAARENYIHVHVCGVTADDGAYCWGGNTAEKTGTAAGDCGTVSCAPSPLPVTGGADFRALAAGFHHTCAASDGGQVSCWGDRGFGQLGTGETGLVLEPTPASGPAATRLAVGGSSGCLATDDDEIWCWGPNTSGEVGDGTHTPRYAPALVGDFPGLQDLVVGGSHACALAGGQAYCWGLNTSGQLGDGTNTARPEPVAVATEHHFIQLAAGLSFTCGLVADGFAFCWGLGTSGQLGDGTTTSRNAPAPVSGEHAFTAIAAGGSTACALTTQGEILCWGANSHGQLGDGTTESRNEPGPVTAGVEFASVMVGGVHACAVTGDGEAYCWGNNLGGRLGDGTEEARTTPTAVAGGLTFETVAAFTHTCGVTQAGAAYCWGPNLGLLGDGGIEASPVPVPVAGGLTFTGVEAGGSATCGMTAAGAVHCWGRAGFVGDGVSPFVGAPTPIQGNMMASPAPD